MSLACARLRRDVERYRVKPTGYQILETWSGIARFVSSSSAPVRNVKCLDTTPLYDPRPRDPTRPIKTKELAEVLGITVKEIRRLTREFMAAWAFKVHV